MNFTTTRETVYNVVTTSGQVVGYGTIAIASFYNPYLLCFLPIYVLATKYSTPLFTSTLGTELGTNIRTAFDPTNALTITAMQPHVKEFFHTFDDGIFEHDAIVAKEFFLGRGVSSMTTAGLCRDVTNWYDVWHNKTPTTLPAEENKLDNVAPEKPHKEYRLDGASSALIKYSTIYLCRTMPHPKGFSEHNNMCAGLGEGAILLTNIFLSNSISLATFIPRVGSEWFIYKMADGARWQVRDKGVIDTAINLIPEAQQSISKTFLSEWAYGITTNSARLIYRPWEKIIVDKLQPHAQPEEDSNTTNVTLPHNISLPYAQDDGICLLNEPNNTATEDCPYFDVTYN